MKKIMIALITICAAFSAFATEYDCTSPDQRGSSVLTVNKVKNTVAVTGTEWCNDFTAKLDTSFRPRTLREYFRFVSSDCSADGTTFILVENKILMGNKNGKMKVQNRGESFENYEYDCNKI